jgi:hypothetical protein
MKTTVKIRQVHGDNLNPVTHKIDSKKDLLPQTKVPKKV